MSLNQAVDNAIRSSLATSAIDHEGVFELLFSILPGTYEVKRTNHLPTIDPKSSREYLNEDIEGSSKGACTIAVLNKPDRDTQKALQIKHTLTTEPRDGPDFETSSEILICLSNAGTWSVECCLQQQGQEQKEQVDPYCLRQGDRHPCVLRGSVQ